MYRNYDQLGSQPEPNRDQYSVPEMVNSHHLAQLIRENKVVCVEIYTDWCGPCKMIAPDYSNIAVKYTSPTNCAVVKYNYDKMEPAEKAGIGGIPTFKYFLDGKQVDQTVGGHINEVEVKLTDIIKRANQQSQYEYPHLIGNPENVYQTVTHEDAPKMSGFSRNSIRNHRPNANAQQFANGYDPNQPQQQNYGNMYTPPNTAPTQQEYAGNMYGVPNLQGNMPSNVPMVPPQPQFKQGGIVRQNYTQPNQPFVRYN